MWKKATKIYVLKQQATFSENNNNNNNKKYVLS